MKCFSEKALKSTAVITVMAFAVTVFGADMRYMRSGTAYADTTTTTAAETTTEDDSNEVNSLIMTDCFDELTLYRWTRVNQNNYPTDGTWHPSLLINKNGTLAMNPTAPDDIWMGASVQNIVGANRFGGTSGEKNFMEQYECTFDYNNSYAIKQSKQPNWKEIYPNISNGTMFYTNSDYNCLYMRWIGTDSKESNIGVDGQLPPRYLMRMSDGKGEMSDYVFSAESGPSITKYVDITTGSDVGDIILSIAVPIFGIVKATTKEVTKYTYDTTKITVSALPDDEKKYSASNSNTLQSFYDSNRGVVWRIFNDTGKTANPRLMSYGGYFVALPYIRQSQWKGLTHYGTANNSIDDDVTWYVGEKLRFTTLRANTVVAENSILQIQNNTFIDENNREQTVTGVMIPAGETLTINPGGILSIEGTLINNGTIINRGTIIVKNKGNITPFLTSGQKDTYGCGAIKCLGGDIIIQNGGTIYGGLNDAAGNIVDFHLDSSSTLINQGLLVYGSMRLGDGARVELYEGSKTYGSFYQKDGGIMTLPIDTNKRELSYHELPAYVQENLGNFVMDRDNNDEPDVTFAYDDLTGNEAFVFYTNISIDGASEITFSAADVKSKMKSLIDKGCENVVFIVDSSNAQFYIRYYHPGKMIEQNDLLTYSNKNFLDNNTSEIKQLRQRQTGGSDNSYGLYSADDNTAEPGVYKAEGAYLNDPNSSFAAKELGI